MTGYVESLKESTKKFLIVGEVKLQIGKKEKLE